MNRVYYYKVVFNLLLEILESGNHTSQVKVSSLLILSSQHLWRNVVDRSVNGGHGRGSREDLRETEIDKLELRIFSGCRVHPIFEFQITMTVVVFVEVSEGGKLGGRLTLRLKTTLIEILSRILETVV